MNQTDSYANRELSWLSFNHRVLEEAADESVPLYERIRFLAIYASNLEEFFRVRVASLRKLATLNKAGLKRLDFDPARLIAGIHEVVTRQHHEFEAIFRKSILPQLRQKDIVLYQGEPFPEKHQKEMVHFFKSKILSYLQPLFLDDKKGKAPFLDNDALYLVICLRQKEKPSSADDTVMAYLNIPARQLGRFIRLSPVKGKHYFVCIEDIVRQNLHTIFPGYVVADHYCIKLDRSGELGIEDEYEGDLVQKIKEHLPKRAHGEPTRFQYEEGMPAGMLKSLRQNFGLQPEDMVPGGRYLNLDDLMKLPNPLSPRLEYEPMPPIGKRELDATESIFESIRRKDYILHFPYHSYDYVLRFFNEAAIDPCVREVKVTLYRIAANSLIANALISAARNGKKVTVFVEVKARFDEANNLRWAGQMEAAGINIIYSIPGLKVHAKIALVRRITPDGKTQGFAYMGTGNFNERTASIYADDGLFTTHSGIVLELQRVFNHLAGTQPAMKFRHLLVAQFNLQDRFLELLDREIDLARAGKPARIVIKLNNLEEKVMIDKLYQASEAGVQVDLLIRGICCLIPGRKGLSENITVTRIVDRFLEHSRIFWFHNNGREEFYLSSADWMKRNLYKRIEVGFPVYDVTVREELKQMLLLQLEDSQKARHLDASHHSKPASGPGKKRVRAQTDFYEWLKEKESREDQKPEKDRLAAPAGIK